MNNAVTKLIRIPAHKVGDRWHYSEADSVTDDFLCVVSFGVIGKKKGVYGSGSLPIAVNEMITNVVISPDIEKVFADHGFSDGYTENEIRKIRKKLCG